MKFMDVSTIYSLINQESLVQYTNVSVEYDGEDEETLCVVESEAYKKVSITDRNGDTEVIEPDSEEELEKEIVSRLQ